ncbi:MAG: hypothetical protein FWC36_01695 [Spirochaetes bacterium]|nr:hypothetical protein [Spirochaetota bacterium]
MIETKRARFATEGFRIKRCNPDRTYATAERTLGFAGVIDISDVLVNNKALLKIKTGWSAWQEKEVDFGSADAAALSPVDAKTALEGAGFTGVTFSIEDSTRRLKVAVIDPTVKELQIKGKLAAALDFGQCRKHGGFGIYYKSYLDDETISISLPNEVKEKEEVDLEGAKGTITRMIIPAKRLGASPVITTKFKDDELLNMIQGGEYTPATTEEPAVYLPPNSGSDGAPFFSLDIFAPLYSTGTSTIDQITGFERRIYYLCTGTEGDVPMDAKAWAQFAYDISATEADDENGKLLGVEKRFEYSLEQFEALRIYEVAE